MFHIRRKSSTRRGSDKVQTQRGSKKEDRLHNLSEAEIAEEYYNMLKEMCQAAAKEIDNNEMFDGAIRAMDVAKKDEFILITQILPFSQALIEYLILLEWDINKKTPPLTQTAIYNSILRLEKSLTKSSFWELVDCEDEKEKGGPLSTITDFEITLMEQTISPFVVGKLEASIEQELFFPLKDPPEADALVVWRILEKIATVNLISSPTIYKRILKEHLKIRLKKEMEDWLKKQLGEIPMEGYRTALKNVHELTKMLGDFHDELLSSIGNTHLIDKLFSAVDCNYCDVIAEVIESHLYDLCVEVMDLLNAYNAAHKEFHVNMRESGVLCHVFYLRLKQIVTLLNLHVKTFTMEKFEKINGLFSKAFLYLLHVVKVEFHSRIHRAVQSEERDTILEEHGISSSTVIVLNCMSTVFEEHKQLHIEEEDMKIAFVVKFTEILCDGCKIFTENMQNRAVNGSENLKDSALLKKICVLANNIQHVLEYISELPIRMQWDNVLQSLGEDEMVSSLKIEVLRILNLVFQSTMNEFDDDTNSILQTLALHVRNHCEKFFNAWLKDQLISDPRLQNVERLLAVLHEQVEIVQECLKSVLFSKFLGILWFTILDYVIAEFQEGKIPDYTKTVKKNMEAIHQYFTTFTTEEWLNSNTLWKNFVTIMELNAKTTMELQLAYYGQLADLVTSPDEYLGHIAFQAGYKKSGRGTIDISVKVQKAQRIPVRKFEINNLRAKVKLCPEFIFPSIKPRETKSVTDDLQNPIFEETFDFCSIPLSVLTIEGAVVQVQIINEDSSFCSEAVLKLSLMHNMSGYTSISFLPVYLMPLKTPDRNLLAFKILEKRRKRDRAARHFVCRQIAPINRRTILFNCISRTNSIRKLLPHIRGIRK